jgi:phosphoribosylformylglycinamidine synthase
MAVALNKFCSEKNPSQMVWHKESGLPKNLDLVAIPGGFSFGD